MQLKIQVEKRKTESPSELAEDIADNAEDTFCSWETMTVSTQTVPILELR